MKTTNVKTAEHWRNMWFVIVVSLYSQFMAAIEVWKRERLLHVNGVGFFADLSSSWVATWRLFERLKCGLQRASFCGATAKFLCGGQKTKTFSEAVAIFPHFNLSSAPPPQVFGWRWRDVPLILNLCLQYYPNLLSQWPLDGFSSGTKWSQRSLVSRRVPSSWETSWKWRHCCLLQFGSLTNWWSSLPPPPSRCNLTTTKPRGDHWGEEGKKKLQVDILSITSTRTVSVVVECRIVCRLF